MTSINPFAGVVNEEDTNVAYSMTGYQCLFPTCFYLASSNVYPYCHDHAYNLKTSPAPHTTSVQSPNRKEKSSSFSGIIGPQTAAWTNPKGIERSMSHSLEDILLVGKKTYNNGECSYSGNIEHNNMCSEHFRQICGGTGVPARSHSPQQEQPHEKPSPARAGLQTETDLQDLQLAGLTRKRTGNQERWGKVECVEYEPQLKGFGNVHRLSQEVQQYMQTSPVAEIINNTDVTGTAPKANYQTKVMEACITQSCTRIGTAGTGGYCSQCYDDISTGHTNQQMNTLLIQTQQNNTKQGTNMISNNKKAIRESSGSPSVDVRTQSVRSSMSTNEEQVSLLKKCSFRDCRNKGNQALKDLCVECYNTLCEKSSQEKAQERAAKSLYTKAPSTGK